MPNRFAAWKPDVGSVMRCRVSAETIHASKRIPARRDRDEIGYVLATSAYRVIDPVVLCAAVLIPLLAESFLQQRESLREDRALVGEP